MSDPKANQEPTMEEILASIRRIISEDGDGAKPEEAAEPAPAAQAAAPPPPPPPPPEPEIEFEAVPAAPPPVEDDVLELTEIVAEQAPPPPPPPPVQAAPPPPPPPPAPSLEELGLVSSPVAFQAASKFSDLASAVTAVRGMPVGNGARTLEDIVKELLRPMLKDWLDQNLSTIVHRIVEREVAKLAGSVEDSSRH